MADLQPNATLALGGRAGAAPVELATAIVDRLDTDTVHAVVSGPGFINLAVPDRAVWAQVAAR